MSEPKILFWDIETSLTIMAGWGLFQEIRSSKNILKDWQILTAAWKWRGKDYVHSAKAGASDKELVKKLYTVLSQADAIVAHNGNKFDMKKFNTRAIYHGLNPLPPVRMIDTFLIAKRRFNFSSNSLDYIAKYLGVEQKAKAEFDLWLGALRGDKKALDEMEKYNKQDVVVLEKIYDKLELFDEPAISMSLYRGDESICPACESTNTHYDGYRYTARGQYRRFRCGDCDKNWQSSKASRLTKNKC